jgi:hypothetical protein
MLFQELKDLIELVPEEHQILVDSVIVHLIPMQVCNVKEALKPSLLLLYAMDFSDLSEELRNLR